MSLHSSIYSLSIAILPTKKKGFCVSDEVLEQDGFGPSCQSPVDLAAARLIVKGECRMEIM